MAINARVNTQWGTISYDALAQGIRIGDRLFPPEVQVDFPGADGQPALAMLLAVVDGAPQCRRITIESHDGGREVRTLDLRAVALEDWIEALYGIVATKITEERDGTTVGVFTHEEGAVREAMRTVQQARAKSRRKIDNAFLESVASTYRQNVDGRPVEAVRAAFGGSYRTAASYVQQARAAGLLPPTTRGRKNA